VKEKEKEIEREREREINAEEVRYSEKESI
jgi:hypothetical protein